MTKAMRAWQYYSGCGRAQEDHSFSYPFLLNSVGFSLFVCFPRLFTVSCRLPMDVKKPRGRFLPSEGRGRILSNSRGSILLVLIWLYLNTVFQYLETSIFFLETSILTISNIGQTEYIFW
jgi:hypothetical protein